MSAYGSHLNIVSMETLMLTLRMGKEYILCVCVLLPLFLFNSIIFKSTNANIAAKCERALVFSPTLNFRYQVWKIRYVLLSHVTFCVTHLHRERIGHGLLRFIIWTLEVKNPAWMMSLFLTTTQNETSSYPGWIKSPHVVNLGIQKISDLDSLTIFIVGSGGYWGGGYSGVNFGHTKSEVFWNGRGILE